MAYTFKHGDRPLEGLTIQRAVGRGGFGEVYYALSDAGKQLAVKYLRDNPDIELRGINNVMNLKSPHLITIFDVRRSDQGESFVIMEYLSGPSLRDVMAAEPGGLPPAKAVFFLRGMAQGLTYLHERGIVHRDLKPANIFYDDGYVKIGDYGLSKHIAISRHSNQTVSVGTVHYMAPEIGSGSYTAAIDIYALGVILYEMLTGRLPFTGASMAEVLMRHLSDHVDVAGLPHGFGPVVARALAKRPEDRYANVHEMLDAVVSATGYTGAADDFDVSTLSQVSREPHAGDYDPTRTSPPPGAPRLDPREWDTADLGRRIGAKVEAKARQVAAKVEAKAAKLEAKWAAKRERRRARHAPVPPPPPGSAAAQVAMLVFVTIGVAAGLTLLAGGSAAFGWGIAATLAGGVLGTQLAYFKLLRHTAARNGLLDRIVYVGATVLCMVPGIRALSNHGAGEIAAALAAIVFICDWTSRIESGRRGRVKGGDAFWPAVFGLLVAAWVGDKSPTPLFAAAVCATASLLTQATAALWPSRPRDAVEIEIEGAAAPPRPPMPPAPPEPPAPDGVRPAGEMPRPAPPVPQPSFVGPQSHGGLRFVGKLLLFVGLLGTVLYPAAQRADFALPGLRDSASQRVAAAVNQASAGAYVALAAAGCVLLVLSRRAAGPAHVLRGVGGAGLIMGAVAVATGPASDSLTRLLISGPTAPLSSPDAYGPLMLCAVPLLIALVLLNWPAAPRDRVVI